MATFDGLTDEVMGHLRAYSADQEPKTYLASSLSDSATSFTVGDPDRVAAGLVEVDEELVEVSSVNTTTGEVMVFPWGRGQGGTTPAAHALNARVVTGPRWPRSRVKTVINEVVRSLWPDLFAVRTDETNTALANAWSYPLPADARRVLGAWWQDTTTAGYWHGIGGWRFNSSANTGDFPNGVALDIADGMDIGRTIRVVYAAEPQPMVNGSDDFATVTGLPDSASDLVALGAAARLVTAPELARTQVFTVEHASRLDGQSPGGATAASRYLQQLYQLRLANERDKLFARYPMRLQRTWV